MIDTQNVCSFCGQPAQSRCRRCSRAYCTEHGGEFCAACSDPVSSLPSHSYFQAVLWGLPVAVILGFWFLIGTPRLPGEHGRSSAVAQTTPVRANPTQAASRAPASAPSAIASATAVAATDYTVREGDTLASIAAASGTTVPAIVQLNPSVDPATLQIGQVLHMPARSP